MMFDVVGLILIAAGIYFGYATCVLRRSVRPDDSPWDDIKRRAAHELAWRFSLALLGAGVVALAYAHMDSWGWGSSWPQSPSSCCSHYWSAERGHHRPTATRQPFGRVRSVSSLRWVAHLFFCHCRGVANSGVRDVPRDHSELGKPTCALPGYACCLASAT